MANPNSFNVTPVTAQGLSKYVEAAFSFSTNKWDIRSYLERMDLYYMREIALATKIQDDNGCKLGKQDEFVVPVIMPQVLTARAFLSNIFLSPEPIFQAVAEPDKEDVAMQITAVICDQAERMAWKRNLSMTLIDGLKYNLMAAEISWDKITSYAPDTPQAVGKATELRSVLWQGNKIKHMNLYNTFWDGRVTPAQIHELGEYAGYIECFGRTRFKKFFEELPMDGRQIEGMKEALKSAPMGSSGGTTRYYQPQLRPDAMQTQNTTGGVENWGAWWDGTPASKSRTESKYNNFFEVVTLYARLVPNDFYLSVPSPKTPQIFKIIVVNGQHVIYVERQTNAHDLIPILFGQPMEDGLEYETKSYAENLIPSQDMASKLWSAEIASTRRIITDRALYDPSRVPEKLINSPNPNAKIPVRPAAYNTPIQQGYYQIPYEDRALGMRLQQATAIMQLSNFITGSNPAKQGQFVKGNKTDAQFQESMGASDSRDLDMALLLEDQFFKPLKNIIKLNILQYQPPGNIFNKEAKQAVEIDPAQLRKAQWDFQMADGLIPPDRLANTETLGMAIQAFSTSEQLQMEYDLVGAFSYLMKLKNVKGLEKFRRSAEDKAALAQQKADAQAQAQAKVVGAQAQAQAQVDAQKGKQAQQQQAQKGQQEKELSSQEAQQEAVLAEQDAANQRALEKVKAKSGGGSK